MTYSFDTLMGRAREVFHYQSKDGRKWEPLGKVKGPMTGDLGMVQRNVEGDGYICYYRLGGRRQPTDHVPDWEEHRASNGDESGQPRWSDLGAG